jgi:hypothetical protein
VQGNYLNAGGQAIYTDRPTVTYARLTGRSSCCYHHAHHPKHIFFMLGYNMNEMK